MVEKEKTIFTVNLNKIDATQKAKAIREVKAIMPSMNLVEVSPHSPFFTLICRTDAGVTGQEVCREFAKGFEGGSD